MNEEEHFYDGLDEIDRQIRIEKLRQEIEERGGFPPLSEETELPSMIEEAFLENVLFFENAPRTTYAKMLIEKSIELPPASDLPAHRQHQKLWEVIRGLADCHVYLCNTDHLSDRELYELLWFDVLNHETVDISVSPHTACHLDILGGGSDADIRNYLRYFADDDERLEWAKDQPAGELPERQVAPYDRDRFLPKRFNPS